MKVTRIWMIAAVLLAATVCYGQKNKNEYKKKKAYRLANAYKGENPYKGKTFKANDIRTVLLTIPVGQLKIVNELTYQLLPDSNGRFYKSDHSYRGFITKVKPAGGDTSAVPRSLTEGFRYRVIDLTEQQVLSEQLISTGMSYFFSTEDFNLDGKPDFAFIGDKAHYHPYPEKTYVWANIRGKLVYWHGLSNVSSDKENVATRMLSIVATSKSGGIYAKYYKVKNDTTLVPFNKL